MKKNIFFSFFLAVLVLSIPAFVGAQSQNVTLSVSTNAATYYGLNALTINGKLQSNGFPSNDGIVSLQVDDSKGNLLLIRSLKTGTTNSPSVPTQINSAFLSDLSGNPQSSISAKALGYFAINVLNSGDTTRNMLVTVNIYDSAGIPIGQACGEISLLAGKSGVTKLSIQIPASAHSGLAHGYANVFTGYPSEGGIPIAYEKDFQFTISNGLTSSLNNAVATNVLQGSYSLAYRLPVKGSIDGIYHIYAFSSGITTPISASFKAYFADLNGDGTVNFGDITTFAGSYIKYVKNDPKFDHLCDMNHDGKIEYKDITLFVDCYIVCGGA